MACSSCSRPTDSGQFIAQAECLGIRFRFVVGTAGSDGYYFSPAEILRTIDLLLGNMSRA